VGICKWKTVFVTSKKMPSSEKEEFLSKNTLKWLLNDWIFK